jgi:hypothetical protein
MKLLALFGICIHKSPPLVSILSQFSPHPHAYFCKIHFNINFPYTTESLKLSIPFKFFTSIMYILYVLCVQYYVYITQHPHACYMSHHVLSSIHTLWRKYLATSPSSTLRYINLS